MATFLSNPLVCIVTLFLLLSSKHCQSTNEVDDFLVELDNIKPMKEKISNFRVYNHEIYTSQPPTSVRVVKSPLTTLSGFGDTFMIDNPITLGPDLNSTTIGRAQGLYTLISRKEYVLLMVLNFVFTEGKYNGSTLTIVGRNGISDELREMTVVGGNGLFRFASGYAKLRTLEFNPVTFDGMVEYSVYLKHY